MALRPGFFTLLSAASATGTAVDWPGGPGTFLLPTGTIGGATVTLQWSGDEGTTYHPIDQGGTTFVTYTAVGAAAVGNFNVAPGKLRAAVASGSPSALNAYAICNPQQ